MRRAARLTWILAVSLALAGIATPPTMAGESPVDVPTASAMLRAGENVAYTLLVPKSVAKSELQARAVIPTGAKCPRLKLEYVGGKTQSRRMSVRAPGVSTASAFAEVRVCWANLPKNLVSARAGAIEIPAALPKVVDDVAVFSDTGCRVTTNEVQDCSNPSAWPLARNAQAIASQRPDVILMPGDYYYREGVCPADQQGFCGGSPSPIGGLAFDDSQYGWFADVLIPMGPAFRAAPILPVRGNHEACNRGGNGYFLFFDATMPADSCAPQNGVAPTNIIPTYPIDLPLAKGKRLRIIVVDSAYGNDTQVSSWVEVQRPQYERAYKLAKPKKNRVSWLTVHRPIYGFVTSEFLTKPTSSAWTSTDQSASADGLLDRYQMLVSSHIHISQAVTIPGLPPQLIIGNGGTLLDPPSGYSTPTNAPLTNGLGEPLSPNFPPYPYADDSWIDVRFGHAIAHPKDNARAWQFDFLSENGHRYRRCLFRGDSMSC